jgi:hypothetical protein
VKKLLVVLALAALRTMPVSGISLYQDIEAGYFGDVGARMGLSLREFSDNYPVGLRFAAGAAYQFNSGDADEARKVFINDNEGGTVRDYGVSVMLGMDLTYKLAGSNELSIHLYGGPRGNFYSAHFAFIGDNEDFAVRHNTFGLGAGALLRLDISPKYSLALGAGVDYYFPSKLFGHGQFEYTPDGVDDNPRNAYTYEDADAVVNQPKLAPTVSLGFSYRL